jgi:hypothetical protein
MQAAHEVGTRVAKRQVEPRITQVTVCKELSAHWAGCKQIQVTRVNRAIALARETIDAGYRVKFFRADEPRFAAAWSAGQTMTLEEPSHSYAKAAPASDRSWANLIPREPEVLLDVRPRSGATAYASFEGVRPRVGVNETAQVQVGLLKCVLAIRVLQAEALQLVTTQPRLMPTMRRPRAPEPRRCSKFGER